MKAKYVIFAIVAVAAYMLMNKNRGGGAPDWNKAMAENPELADNVRRYGV